MAIRSGARTCRRETSWPPSSSGSCGARITEGLRAHHRVRADSEGDKDRMKIDGGIGFNPAGVGEAAREVEALGYDGAWAAETGHDPFLPLALAAQAPEH